MKSFKKYLKEARVSNMKKGEVLIEFENIGGGIAIHTKPYNKTGSKYSNDVILDIVKSGGQSLFTQSISREEVEYYLNNTEDDRRAFEEDIYFDIEFATKQLVKAASEFEKKVIDIMKKAGFEQKI